MKKKSNENKESHLPQPYTPILTLDVIKKYICSLATDQEAYMFLELCKAQRLNPFLKEAYLIKYSAQENATMVTGKETFTKRAERHPQFDGFKAGVIVKTDTLPDLIYRIGSMVQETEKLIGGWAEVFRKDKKESFRNEISMNEYIRLRKDGTPMRNWKDMPATMIRKVALVQALREAFPDTFAGLYSPEEMPVEHLPPDYQNPENSKIHKKEIKTPVQMEIQ